MKTVDIVIPVYYGSKDELEESIAKQVKSYSQTLINYDWQIVIGINGPNCMEILEEAIRVSEKYPNVTLDHTDIPGKGSSIKEIFSKSSADILVFMDVDLSTDLKSVPDLIQGIEEGYDISSGSRYLPESIYERKFLRTFISKFYIKVFVNRFLGVKVTDP